MQERWIIDLVGAVLAHEDEHPKDDRCFQDVVGDIPDDVKIAARAVREFAVLNELQEARLEAIRAWALALTRSSAPQYGHAVLTILGLSLDALREAD